jgi:threonine synthase
MDLLKSFKSLSFKEIAFHVGKNILSGEIEDTILKKIIDRAIYFDAPLVKIDKDIYSLELFHGPTLAFKDFGAGFMAGLMEHYAERLDREIYILVATSGDTGTAVAHGFLNKSGIRVIILYPSGKVSPIQEKQLTTAGGNVEALEIEGTFDDCQKLVKEAFLDRELNEKHTLTSANSINIARLIPQSFYYFYAWSRLAGNIVFSVPSGNFGNLTAGLMAKKMGLPVCKFIASANINDVVPEYLKTGIFTPRLSVKTMSNAMDVGNPSNFARMMDLYDSDLDKMREDISGYSFTDGETKKAMKDVFMDYSYILDPHGAVGYLGLMKYKKEVQNDFTGVFLETAHPAKFIDLVEPVVNTEIEMPERLKVLLDREKKSTLISKEFVELKNYLL